MSLKVKQISDYLSATNSLISGAQVNIDASIDSLESEVSSNLSAISADLSEEISATGSEVTSLTTRISTEESTHAAEFADLSDALSTEISTTNSEVVSIDVRFSGIDVDMASVATDADVTSLQTRISTEESTHAAEFADLSGDVSAILAGASANLDSFAEVISYLNSVDATNDLDLTNSLSSIDTRLSTGDSTDVVISNALSTEIAATNAEVSSIDVVLAGLATASAFGSLETRVSNDEDDLVSALGSIDARISTEEDQHSGDYAELSSVNASEVASIDTRFGGVDTATGSLETRISTEESTHEAEWETLSTEVVNEVASIDVRLSGADSGIGSLETALDGFAKEAYIHGIVSNIDTANGNPAEQVLDAAGIPLGDLAEVVTLGTATFDLTLAVEGNNDVEREANLVWLSINGLLVPHAAIRFLSPTRFTITAGQLGYAIEPADVVEYKYIKD